MAHHSTEAIQQMQNRGIPYHHSSIPLLTLLHSLTVQDTVISLTEIMFTGGHTCNFPSFLSSFHHLCYTVLTILFYDYIKFYSQLDIYIKKTKCVLYSWAFWLCVCIHSFIMHSVNPYKVNQPIGYRVCHNANVIYT